MYADQYSEESILHLCIDCIHALYPYCNSWIAGKSVCRTQKTRHHQDFYLDDAWFMFSNPVRQMPYISNFRGLLFYDHPPTSLRCFWSVCFFRRRFLTRPASRRPGRPPWGSGHCPESASSSCPFPQAKACGAPIQFGRQATELPACKVLLRKTLTRRFRRSGSAGGKRAITRPASRRPGRPPWGSGQNRGSASSSCPLSAFPAASSYGKYRRRSTWPERPSAWP